MSFSLVASSRGYSNCCAWTSHWGGFSYCGSQAGSREQSWQLWRTGLNAPRHVGSSGSGIEFLSPALVDGFFTTEPLGKHPSNSFTKTPWASIQQKASPREREDKWLSSSRWRELLFIVAFIMILSYLSFKYAAAVKLLQLCPTLCNPRDGSPPGSPVPGILQARTLEWVAISFSNAWKWKVTRSVVSDS